MVKKWNSTVLALGSGLLLSVLATFILFSSSQLANKGINEPASQCFLYYLLLALVNGGIMIYRRKPRKERLFSYMWLALIDTLVNRFAINAIQRTSPTSVMLLDNWTITCFMLLAWLFLNEKFGVQILVGIATCVASYVIVFISEVHSVHGIMSDATNLLVGDGLVIIGATFSSVNFVSQIYVLKKDDLVTRRALLGIFGAMLTGHQIITSESSDFKFIFSSPVTIFLVIGFSLSKFFLYLGFHFFYKKDGSTMLNLSILVMSNMCVILIRIFAYNEKVDWIYFVAVAITTLGFGLILFSKRALNNVGISNKNRHKFFSIGKLYVMHN